MQHLHSAGRALLLALPCCQPAPRRIPRSNKATSRLGREGPTGVFADFMVGRFAMSQSDPQVAASQLLRALAAKPDDTELLQQAFGAALIAGRGEAVQLARRLPDSQAAQLLLGAVEARAGHWQAAEQKFHALPRQGLTQLLQPLLVAWAQQGGGHTDAALATLHPYLDGQRFRGVYALHAALIADQAGRNADAAKLYRAAQTEFGGMNLRLAQILASWEARRGHLGEAQRTLAAISDGTAEMTIALPALVAASMTRPVPRAIDGIAEAYLALAAAVRQQDSGNFSMILLRLALDLRPDFTPARVLAAELLESGRHLDNALQMLAAVGNDDPLIAVIRLQRAALAERLGNTEDAMRDLQRIARDYPSQSAASHA